MRLDRVSSITFVLILLGQLTTSTAFAPTTTVSGNVRPHVAPSSSTTTTTSLNAIGALAKKAKQADLKQYVADGIEDSVMAVYKKMKSKMNDNDIDLNQIAAENPAGGPLQQALTKRRGTITVIAEFKRKNSECENGYINTDIFAPELLSPIFREYGASAAAVMADSRMGGCDYKDLAVVIEEQRRANSEVPGPIPVINNDLIVDELQVARSAAMGCAAVVVHLAICGAADTAVLLKAAHAAGIEAIVAVSSIEEAQTAVDMGARMLSIIHVEGADAKTKVLQQLKLPQDERKICIIANILARNNKQLQEIEEAWTLRDRGFNAVWVGEALYKGGASFSEHPGAVIRSMKSKSSVKWASPKGTFVYVKKAWRTFGVHVVVSR